MSKPENESPAEDPFDSIYSAWKGRKERGALLSPELEEIYDLLSSEKENDNNS